MRKINRLILLIVGALFINFLVVNGQESNRELPLSEILATLQKEYNIQFNYAEDIVVGIALKPPPLNLSLPESIMYLEENTNLSFTSLNDSFVLISLKASLFLCGYLKSSENALPIVSATVQGIRNSTVSDELGFFQLEVEDKNEIITIRHLGFKVISKSYHEFALGKCNDILLESQFQNLSEIIISNYITNGISKLSDGSFTMNFSNFGILPGLVEADVLHSVQAFPGIQSINETVSNISIRGGAHDQNLILWDGIKMYQSGHFFGLISMYNPQITHKVTLTKNGSNASLTDGTSGTIAMQTDEQVNTKFKGNIGVNFTDFNGFIDVPTGKTSSLQIAARKSLSDFIETPTYRAFFNRISQNTEVENNTTAIVNSDKSFDFYDTSLRWLYNISDKDFLRINFINVSNELQFNENAMVDNESKVRQSNVSQNSIAEGIHYKRVWNDNFHTTFEIYETDYRLKAVNANVLESQRFLQENKVSETSLKLNVDSRLSDTFTLLNGYHFVETEVTNLDDVDNPIFRELISEVVRTHGLFSQFAFRSKNANTNLVSGVRFNYIDKFNKTIFEPRFSFNQRFLDYFTFEILGELKHQNTSQVINFQNDFLGIEKRRWQLSNDDDIPIIRSEQVSTGINFNKMGLLISTEGYYKKVKGITSQSQGFLNQYEFIRSDGSYKVFGIDFLIRKSLNRFNSWLSYSYMDNNYKFNDFEPYPFPSNYDVNHSVSLGTTFTTNNLKVAAGLNWHSGKPTTKPVQSNEIVDGEINYDHPNSASLEDYLRIDVSAIYNLNLGKNTNANIGLSVWNVLDKENIINNYYRFVDDEVNEIQQQSLGLTPNVIVRVFFN